MTDYVISNVSNLAAYGAEWTVAGTRYQLVNARGTDSLRLGILPAGATRWISTSVDEPQRFGMPTREMSAETWLSIAEAFVHGS